MGTFFRRLKSPITNTEKLKQELKQKFPEVFSGGLGKCRKMKAQFQVKDHARPIFEKKRNVSFAALEQIDEELYRLGKAGIRSKTDFKLGFAPIFQELNQALKDHHYPLPTPEEIFNKLNGGKIFSKIDYRMHIFKSRWERILDSFFFLYRKKKLLGAGCYGTVIYPLMDFSKSYINR